MLKIFANSVILSILISLNSAYSGGGGGGGGGGALGIEFTEIKISLLADTINSDSKFEKLSRGFYNFTVTNNSEEKVEFIIQELDTDKVFKKVSLKPGKQKSIKLKLSDNGIRYSASNIEQWFRYELN